MVDGSDRLALLRTFESLLGLPAGFLVPEDDVVNRSLTLAETEVVRQLNEEFKRREWPGASYARFVRYGAVKQMKARRPLPGEPQITTPAWALERVAEISAEMTRNIAALGVRVVGDLSALRSASARPRAGGGSGGRAGGSRHPGGGRRAGRARGHSRGRDGRSGGGSCPPSRGEHRCARGRPPGARG